jgi:hypothetical protein
MSNLRFLKLSTGGKVIHRFIHRQIVPLWIFIDNPYFIYYVNLKRPLKGLTI